MNKSLFLILALTVLLTAGCQDSAWDDHYSESGSAKNASLMETLRNDGRFSEFVRLLESTGGDSLLAFSQTYTIFAPDNDALSGVTADSTSMVEIIKNHVARYLYGPSDLADTAYVRVKMLNGKYQELTKQASTVYFAGIALNDQPLVADNGVIWPMKSKADYYDNLWEIVQHRQGTFDSIYSYLASFNDTTTSRSSVIVGEDNRGRTLYFHNEWMKKYGSIHLEDSLYTAIIPSNAGWTDAYQTIAPYFRTFGPLIQDRTASGTIIYRRTYETGDAISDSLQDAHTREMIVHDMLFRKRPDFYHPDGDTLATTNYNTYHHPSYLIEGLTQQTASNGLYYQADAMPQKVEDSFLKEIKVEAEQSAGRAMNYATLSRRSAVDSPIKDSVSDMAFIEVLNTSTNNLMQPQVVFDLPDVLAARYDIYAVFVPAMAFDTLAIGYQQPDTLVARNDTVVNNVRYSAGDSIVIQYPYYDADSTKVCFYLNYVHETTNASGYNMYEDAKIAADPVTGEPFVTKGYEVTTFLVAKNFSFPFANYASSAFASSNAQTTNTKIRVATNLTNADKGSMGYTMRLDYILLKPVTE
ncbi:MAG: fasciclin domain-containing protein [Bacteroidales bacterium]|nr:fasciclin domain-containing protein [Bacteroidales bacterium]